MGQYKEWLFYREIDQQLTTQIQAFEQELAQIQAEIGHLEHDTRYTENIILQALVSIQQAQQANSQRSASNATTGSTVAGQKGAGSVSPALFAWSQLPDFDNRDVQPSDEDAAIHSPLPPLNGSEGNLLPTDISAFVDAHSQTDPQLKVPWWLRNAHTHKTSAKDAPSTSPVDQQSNRTNQLVERWFERWGERTKNSAPKQEGQTE